MSQYSLNTAFDPAAFLQDDWQQRPRLIRQLIPGFSDAIESAELAGLACEEAVESRLVRQIQTGRWSVAHGPFAESVFQQLPDENWTLLVQAVDQWDPAVASLKQAFAFIPQWRIEDVMVSYAEDGGGVGPHFDYYDVFLLQGSGRRRWQVGPRVPPETRLENQDGVGILPNFVATDTFELEPGDALYIPPQFAHWGTSIGVSQCYSIGFRAPAVADMLEGYSDSLITGSRADERYVDPMPRLPSHPGRLEHTALEQVYADLQNRFANPRLFRRWFGCYATQPKYPELRDHATPSWDSARLQDALAAGERLQHHPGSRFAYLVEAESLVLFADGDAFDMPLSCEDAVAVLSLETTVMELDNARLGDDGALRNSLLQLLNQGSLILA